MSKSKDFNKQVNKRIFATLVFAIGFTSITMAQGLLDWITDPIGSAGAYVESYVESKTKEVVSNIWEGVLESNIQSDLDKNAKKIAEFPIDNTTYPAQVYSNFPQWADNDNPLPSIRTKLAEAPIDYLRYNYKGGKISEFGKGAVYDRLAQQADSVRKENRILQLSEIFSSQTMDSVKVLSLDENGTFFETLLEHPSLALVFNSHPELLRLNATWMGLPIANDTRQLQYWGTIANKEDTLLPQKIRPYNHHELKFNTSSTNEVLISSSKGENLGVINPSYTVTPKSIDLLNLHPMPKATYKVEKNTYKTDYLGRVIKVQYALAKEKSGFKKGKIKAKNVMQLLQSPDHAKPFFLVPIKQQGTESRLNIVPLVMSDHNKQQLKAYDKKVKEVCKTKTYAIVMYELFYTSATDTQVPEYILIHLSGDKFLLSNNPMSKSVEYVIYDLEKQKKTM